MLGHRRLRLSSNKRYYERNKPKERPEPLVVSISLELCRSTLAPSTQTLQSRFQQFENLPLGWKCESNDAKVYYYLFKYTEHLLRVTHCVTVKPDFSWIVSFQGHPIDREKCSILRPLSDTVQTVADLSHLISITNSSQICVGNANNEFLALPNLQEGGLKDASGAHMVAKVDSDRLGHSSLFHINCEILVGPDVLSRRCLACSKHRNSLSAMVSRCNEADERTNPSSHTRYSVLSSAEKQERLYRVHKELKTVRKEVKRLRERINNMIASDGLEVEEDIHGDLKEMASGCADVVFKTYPEGSFERVFWEEQTKASSLKDHRQMRWHPLFIKWCLYLRHLSGKAYELVRSSGCIQLPSQRTLRDYTHYVSTTIGFSAEVDEMLLDAAKPGTNPLNPYVCLSMDEVHIKEDLVYDKHFSTLLGFVNFGDINNHLCQYEASLGSQTCPPMLAKSMMVFMVRGLFQKLAFPYAQFACADITGDLLIDPFWEAVFRLERNGLKVMALTCDGASTNRRLWKIHSGNSSDGVVHKINNIFATDQPRYLYFMSDPPHLMKTIRNCLWSKKRNLMHNDMRISWSHLEQLYKTDTKGLGLRIVPKLKFEHVYLTNFSKMRVDLAAQVLSESVANAIELTSGADTAETVRFIRMVDRFFDCLNVKNFSAGKHKRKPFQDPYLSGEDFRLKWLEDEFLQYLKEWEQSVMLQGGISSKVKQMMLLSAQTREGIYITVKSFVELVRYLFTNGKPKYFLSERISQDPLEKFFGCQRQRGRSNENLNVHDFCKNTQALRVINTMCGSVSKGNCRANVEEPDLDQESHPIPKRRRKH